MISFSKSRVALTNNRVCSNSVANIECPNFFHCDCGNIHVPESP